MAIISQYCICVTFELKLKFSQAKIFTEASEQEMNESKSNTMNTSGHLISRRSTPLFG